MLALTHFWKQFMPSRLQNKRVLVTRAIGQNEKLIQRLAALKAVPVELPTIKITPPDDLSPLDTALLNLTSYDWVIFTSVNGVRFFHRRLLSQNIDLALLDCCKIASIGPATTACLAELNLSVTQMPREHIAEALLEAMSNVDGQRILIPTADIARSTLANGLRAKGALVDQVIAYQTRPADAPTNLAARLAGLDILTFTSSSTVQNFAAMLMNSHIDPNFDTAIIACIGPKTAETAREFGFPVHIIAADYTVPGLVEAMEQYKNYRTYSSG